MYNIDTLKIYSIQPNTCITGTVYCTYDITLYRHTILYQQSTHTKYYTDIYQQIIHMNNYLYEYDIKYIV